MTGAVSILLAFLISIGAIGVAADGTFFSDYSVIDDPAQRMQIESIIDDNTWKYLEENKGNIIDISERFGDRVNGKLPNPEAFVSLAATCATVSLAYESTKILDWLLGHQDNIVNVVDYDSTHVMFSDGSQIVILPNSDYQGQSYNGVKWVRFFVHYLDSEGRETASRPSGKIEPSTSSEWYSGTWYCHDNNLADGLVSSYMYNNEWLAVEFYSNYERTETSTLYYPVSTTAEAVGNPSTESPPDIGVVTLPDGTTSVLNPDGSVTVDGTTYYPNADGTYDIGGSTVTPDINVNAFDNAAILDLIMDLLGDNAADTSNPSGETYNYTGILGQILGAINAVKQAVSTGLNSVADSVRSIPKVISDIFSVDFDKLKEVFNSNFEILKKRVSYNTLVSNIDVIATGLFGKRVFNNDGTVTIGKVFSDGSETSIYNRPHFYFTVYGVKCDLFAGFYLFDKYLPTFKMLIAFFINVKFIFSLIRAIPSILMSVGEFKVDYDQNFDEDGHFLSYHERRARFLKWKNGG